MLISTINYSISAWFGFGRYLGFWKVGLTAPSLISSKTNYYLFKDLNQISGLNYEKKCKLYKVTKYYPIAVTLI
jgi:hypothetical protein